MPEAVGVFNDSGSFMDAFDVQKDIIQTYQMDFAKYAGHADTDCLREVLLSVAQQVGQQVKYSSLSTRFSHTTVTKAYRLLETARLIKSVRSVNPSGLPLGASFSNKRFKPLFIDIGLLQNICGISRQADFESAQLLDIYRGALAEQFVGQELLCFMKDGPWYWSNNKKSSTAEVDYCFVQNGAIVPIEVKSGTGGRLKSLTQFLSRFTVDSYSIVFSSRPYMRDDTYRIVYLPFYYTGTVFGKQ
jgi:predicted AAA+ superfamily ATPase